MGYKTCIIEAGTCGFYPLSQCSVKAVIRVGCVSQIVQPRVL